MQIGDDESSAMFEDAKHLPVVRLEIRKVTLVQVRHGNVKGRAVQKTQVLYVGHTVLLTARLHGFGGLNHGPAEIEAQDICSSPTRKKSAEPPFTASAIQDPLTPYVSACLKHRRV